MRANEKSVIARWPCAILANIFLVSHCLLLFEETCENYEEYENLVKYLSNPTLHRAVPNT